MTGRFEFYGWGRDMYRVIILAHELVPRMQFTMVDSPFLGLGRNFSPKPKPYFACTLALLRYRVRVFIFSLFLPRVEVSRIARIP